MKTKLHFIKGTILMTSVLSAIAAQAQGFSYNTGVGANGDLMVCFRPNSGSYDLVVDAGSVSTFTNLAKGQSITIDPAYYTGTQLSYEGTNNIHWSAFACERLSGFPSTNNIWITRPRTSPFVQSTPWPCKPSAEQANAASQIDAIGRDAGNISSQGTSPSSTSTAVVEPEGGSSGSGAYFNSYSFMMGAGNLGGNFWGDATSVSVEQSTPTNFVSSGQPVIADFYQLLSANNGQLGTYLGYFTFKTNGVLTYTAGPSIVPPTITSVTRTGTTTTIMFASVAGGTYSLLATNAANITAPRSTWPVVATPITGDGATDTFTDTTTDATRVYSISVH